jgi:hypothetical protein
MSMPAAAIRSRPLRRVLVIGAVVLTALGVVAVMLAGSSEPAPISGVTVNDGGTRLVVEYVAPSESCGGDSKVDVEETDTKVTVTAETRKPFRLGTSTCLPRGRIAHATVVLGAPLGERQVVDGSTGGPVPVARGNG